MDLGEPVQHISTALDVVNRGAPDGPVVIARPHRVRAAADWFLAQFPGEVFYAVKANPSPWVIDALWEAGVRGFDVASEAEIDLIKARYPQATLAFMHPVKSRRAIRRAYEQGVRAFALDSEDELDKILAETDGAKDLTLIVRLAVSNDAASLPLAHKFGVSASEAPALIRRARAATEEMLGISFHVGSQCMRPLAYKQAMLEANRVIVQAGVVVDIINVGGGFPAIYPGMQPPEMHAYMREIRDAFEEMYVAQNAKLWAEPGRALVAEAGSILARVDLRKGDALYLNDGAYGNLFDATHVHWPFPVALVREGGSNAKNAPFRFYGPTCDSMDAAAGPYMLPADIAEGDFIEIGMTGAYGVAMATRFNGFGESRLVFAADAPWPTLFVTDAPEALPAEPAAPVVRLADRKGRQRRSK
ncbi:MAG: type III PLP-dependent enzyme [Alphaproteobacteria bacterium]|nr:type III PLP-dependent enzyme [Alphaproteobacteria bacterium]